MNYNQIYLEYRSLDTDRDATDRFAFHRRRDIETVRYSAVPIHRRSAGCATNQSPLGKDAGQNGPHVIAIVASAFQPLVRFLYRRFRQYDTIRWLNSLSDRDLADVGLERSDIAASVDILVESRNLTMARVVAEKRNAEMYP